MSDFSHERAQNSTKRFAAFGDALRGTVTDKCLLLLASMLLPFSVLIAVVVTLFHYYPEVAAQIGARDPGWHARLYWLNVVVYALFALVGLVLRHRSPHSRVFLHSLLQYIWVSLTLAVYSLGPFTTPVLVGVLGTWIVLCALFDLRPVAHGAATSLALMVGLFLMTHFGVISYEPALVIPFLEGRPPSVPLLVLGSVTVAFLVAIMMMTGLLFVRLRKRERELEMLSTLDSLTQVANRRSFLKTLDVEMARAARHQHKLALMMVDIDLFKTINDGFGHRAGDQVLVSVVKLLTDLLRRSDIAARFGGDEFIVLLPETDLAGAQMIAERCRREIASVTLLCTAERISGVTVSIGVAASLGVANESVDDLIDRALYTAKRNGRNRIEIAA